MNLQGEITVVGLACLVLTPWLGLPSPFLWEAINTCTMSILNADNGLGLSGEVVFEVLSLPSVVIFFRSNIELFV